jgi:hypothetical protein
VVDDAAEPEAEPGGEHQIDAGDHAGREYRPGLEEHPEGDREPNRKVGDVGDEVVAEDLVERAHRRAFLAADFSGPPYSAAMTNPVSPATLPHFHKI